MLYNVKIFFCFLRFWVSEIKMETTFSWCVLAKGISNSEEEMPKQRFRDSIKSLFGSHIDSENDKQIKGGKIGIFYIKIMSICLLEVEMVFWKQWNLW